MSEGKRWPRAEALRVAEWLRSPEGRGSPMTLNHYQRAAVEAPDPAVQISAAAGTGKSRVVVERAFRLAEVFERVRLVTFSRRAVRVLRARVEEADAPDELRERISVDTHHGLATSLLRDHGHLIGWEEGWAVVDREEEKTLKAEAKDQLDLFSARLQRSRLVTYDQLLPAALRLLQEHPEVLDEECAGACLICDEAQDNSNTQTSIDLLLGRHGVTFVGDEAQRIYGWNGATGTADLCGPPWLGLTLPLNYRSRQEILDAANRLPIPGRVDLRSAERLRGGRVESWTCASDEEIVDILLADREFRDHPEGWAILARVNRRLEKVAEQLRAAGVPVRAPFLAGKAWDTPEARALVDLLHVVANPHDSLHLARVLERAGWTRGQLAEAEYQRSDPAHPCSLWDWCCTHPTPGTVWEEITALRENDFDAAGCAEEFRMTNLCPPGPQLPADLSPAEALAWLADPDRDEPEGEEGCYLGTVHSAKGEEYESVMVLGLEEGSLPLGRWADERRTEEERIAEERRLLYVAVTRARDRLILARRTEKWVRGRGHLPAEPSRFLEEVQT